VLIPLIATTLRLLPVPAPAQTTTTTEPQSLWQQDTLTGDWGGLRTRLVNDGFTFGLQQESELWINTMAGLAAAVRLMASLR
jgi:hypothetical protein